MIAIAVTKIKNLRQEAVTDAACHHSRAWVDLGVIWGPN